MSPSPGSGGNIEQRFPGKLSSCGVKWQGYGLIGKFLEQRMAIAVVGFPMHGNHEVVVFVRLYKPELSKPCLDSKTTSAKR